MSEFTVIETTVGSSEEAERIAGHLVEARLAACVQILGPLTSVYRWKGKIEKDTEFICLAKTRAELFAAASAAIREVHSYEEPQIIALDITAGSSGYLRWLDEQTR